MKLKEDRRIRYTKMVLRESLLDLIKDKRLNQISITELCKAADVNRNTFYNHYNTPYEILREMEDEMFNALMDSIKDIDNVDGLILAACKALEQDKKMSKVIFSEIDASSVLFKTLASFRNRELPTAKNGELNKQNLLVDKAYLFGEKGTIAIIQDWVLGGFKEPAELIAEIISFLVQNINESIKSYGK